MLKQCVSSKKFHPFQKKLNSQTRYVPRLDRGIQDYVWLREEILSSRTFFITGPRGQATGRRKRKSVSRFDGSLSSVRTLTNNQGAF